jgi:hypothetical protein
VRPTPELPCDGVVVFEAVSPQFVSFCRKRFSTAGNSNNWRQVIIERSAS